jgi:type I restriction enzyme S subunit
MKDWEKKSLGEVCEIVNGSTPLRTNKAFWDYGDFPWFTIDDIREQGRIITETKQKVTKAALSKLRVLPIDTVLLCCTASVGEYAITKIELTTNQQFNGLVVKDRKKLDPLFLMHYCSTLKDKLLGLSGKTTIDFIAISKLKPLEIPFPSLPEQQRIVAILDECFAVLDKALANAEQNFKNAKELFESYLQGVFDPSKRSGQGKKGDGWEEKRFDEVCVLQRGFDLPTHSRFEGEYPLVSSNGITDSINQWKVKAPGVVTGRSGTIGNVHFIEEDFWPLNTALYIKDFHGNDERFIYYFLTAFDLSKYSSGAGVPTLNRNNVHIVKVSIPKSKEEQQTIVRQLDALRAETQKLEAVYQKKIADLGELKKSILQKAFAGELTNNAYMLENSL